MILFFAGRNDFNKELITDIASPVTIAIKECKPKHKQPRQLIHQIRPRKDFCSLACAKNLQEIQPCHEGYKCLNAASTSGVRTHMPAASSAARLCACLTNRDGSSLQQVLQALEPKGTSNNARRSSQCTDQTQLVQSLNALLVRAG